MRRPEPFHAGVPVAPATPQPHPPMPPRNLLLSLFALVLVAAGAGLWFLGSVDGREARVDQRPAAPVAPTPDELVGLERGAGERTSAVDPLVAGGLRIDAGVRVHGTGQLTGLVLDRRSGAPLAGARVELFAVPPAGAPFLGRLAGMFDDAARYLGTGEPLATAGTDAAGAFRFEGVRRGQWYVQARGERHVPDTVARVHVTESGAGGPAEVYVREGGRIVGRVLKPDGSGAPGAAVTLLPSVTNILESARTGSLCWLEATTEKDGTFVIPGVPPGPGFDLYAEGRGFALSFVLDVPVRAGEDAEVEIRARRGGRITGRLVSAGAGRPPLAGAHVAALPHGLRYLPFAPSLLAATHTQTDARGGYVLRDVPPGDVDVVGFAPGHVAALGPTVFVPEGSSAAATDFELAVGPTVRGRVVDGAGEPLAGVRVTWDPVGLDRFEFAGSFAPLVAKAVGGVDFPVTGADGRFEAGAFPGEPPYRIELSKEGYARIRHEWTPAPVAADEEPEELEIVMARGGWVEGIVMDAAAVAPLGRFSIKSEQLLAGGGPPVAGPFGSGVVFEGEDGRFRVGPLHGEGDDGEVELEIDAPGYLMTVKQVVVADGETKRGVIVELFPGGIMRGTVTDEDGTPVPGALVFSSYEDEGASERPENWDKRRGRGGRYEERAPKGLASYAAQLGVAAANGSLSDVNGRFELDGIEPGVQRIGAVHRDYASSWSEPVLVVHGAAPAETEIVLRNGGAVYGHVSDRFDRPITGAIVVAMAPGNMGSDEATGDALFQGTTDEEGAYRIDHVAQGTYFMVLTRGDEVLEPMSFLGTLSFDMVTVPEGEEVEYDIVDNSVGGTRVFGRVIAQGLEVGYGQVTAMSFEGESLLGLDLKIARIREGGSYEFEGLAPGEYQLQISAAGLEREARMQIDVPDVPEYPLDLLLPEGRITGRVLDAATGEPVSSAWLSAESDQALRPEGLLSGFIGRESGLYRASVQEDGAFAFERLQAAGYRITVRRAQGDGQRYAPGEPVLVELRENQHIDDLEIRLEPSLSVAGTVRNEAGDPVAGASLSMWIEGRRDTLGRGSSAEDGRFEVTGLMPGSHVLSASHDDYAATRLTGVVVSREREQELSVTLEAGVAVSVRILGADGQPVAGAAARLRPAEGEVDPGELQRMFSGLVEGDGVSDLTGHLELGRFGPGSYTLEAQHGATRAEPQTVTLERGAGSVRLEVRLR